MKKLLCLAAALLCIIAATAGAEKDLTAYTIASGNVAAVESEDLTAPWSGTLLTFDWAAGDPVQAGQELFAMRLETVYAPENGNVEEVFAVPGDDASATLTRYGALISLEGELPYRIQASINGAIQKKENKVLHVGERLYFRSEKVGREEGYGRVISVSGNGYVVEIEKGSFEIGENLNLFRKEDYAGESKVGNGAVFRRDPVSVSGRGRVGSVLVSPGDKVRAGQPLMTLMGLDADPGARAEVAVSGSGIIAQVMVSPGQQVWKGAVLARVWHTERLEVIAEVDEMDLGTLAVGDECPVILDMYPDMQLTGKVTEIGGIGVTRQNAAYFQVHFELKRNDLPLGASASVYLPKEK